MPVAGGRRHLFAPAPGRRLAVARRTPLFPPAGRGPVGRCQSKALGEIKALGETKALGDWPANLGKYQPSDAGGDEKRGDRIVAGLLCEDRQDIISPRTR